MVSSRFSKNKFLPAVAILGIGTLFLSGCSLQSDDSKVSTSSCAAPGDLSTLVETTGNFGQLSDIEYPRPFKSAGIQRSVYQLKDSSSNEIVEVNRPMEIRYALYAATNGLLLEQSGFQEGESTILTSLTDISTPLLNSSLLCAKEGQRTVTIAPVSSLTQSDTEGLFGLSPEETLILVADIERIYPAQSVGIEKTLPSGFPQVVFAATGQPGLTLLDAAPPADFMSATLVEGQGSVIKDGDQLVVKYTSWAWQKPLKVNYTTWNSGQPEILTVQAGSTNMSEGLKRALVGATSGSRIMVIVPPALGSTANVTATSTMIYVIDILGVR
ncbi:MAG: FKBP-type peptidyl-prolyl cis-trans isomerase [Microbacteriaceae bacterium]|nr:FKBP-type peptidyl-prolyl cis-trans isomerase [Microbacteriaceae bacterium]